MAVSGSTSAFDGSVELSTWNPTNGAFGGTTQANVFFISDKVFSEGIFNGTLDISASGGSDGDTIAVRAQRDSDDVLPIVLDEQKISRIQVYGVPETAAPESNVLELDVYDETGRGVIGAEVRRSSDGSVVGYTGPGGYRLDPAQRHHRHLLRQHHRHRRLRVRDRRHHRPGHRARLRPGGAAAEAELADGTVFDDQEYADGDIALQVVDGRGDPYAAQEDISYALYPSDEEPPSEWTLGTTDEDGASVVPFDPAGMDGECTLAFSAPGSTAATRWTR